VGAKSRWSNLNPQAGLSKSLVWVSPKDRHPGGHDGVGCCLSPFAGARG
jgi:hypothetical protein